MPTLTCAAFSPNDNAFFGFFEGESDGYMFKAQPYPEIETEVQGMLKAEPDLSIKAITYGLGQWFVHAQHEEKPPEGREFLIYKNYDGFSKGVSERVKNGRALRVAHCFENYWVAYFEGQIEGKCATVVSDTTAEMLEGLQTQISDNDLSLECITHGEGAWFAFYLSKPSHEQGDSNWVVNNKYAGEGSFQETLRKYCDGDVSLRKVCYAEKVWFGYWEGTVAETSGWAWHSDPTLDGFLDKIKTEWDADDEENAEGATSSAAEPRAAATPLPSGTAGDGAVSKPASAPASDSASAPVTGGDAPAPDESALSTKRSSIALPTPQQKEYKTDGGVDWGVFTLDSTEIPGPLAEKDAEKLKAEWLKKFGGHEAKFQKGVSTGSMTEKVKTKLLADAQKDFNKISDKAKKLSAKFVKDEEKRLAKEAKAAAKKK